MSKTCWPMRQRQPSRWHGGALLALLVLALYRLGLRPSQETIAWDTKASLDAPHVPKVALLWLSRGPMPHEALWAAWLGAAAGVAPRDYAVSLCRSGFSGAQVPLEETCRAAVDAASSVAGQLLFSVYVHAPPSFEGELVSPLAPSQCSLLLPGMDQDVYLLCHAGYPNSSLWSGRLIEARVGTRWGDHSLTAATKALITAAFEDPNNEW